MIEISAILASVILVGLSIFQLSLILGAPLGKYAWGGANEVLPTKLRVSSGVAMLLYVVFVVLILSKAEILNLISSTSIVSVGVWVVTVYLFIGTLANLASKSKYERAVMTPTSFVLAILFLFVALS